MGCQVSSGGQAASDAAHYDPHEVAAAVDRCRSDLDQADSALADVLRDCRLNDQEKDQIIRTLIDEGPYARLAFFAHAGWRTGVGVDRHELDGDLQVIANALQGAYDRGVVKPGDLKHIADACAPHGGKVRHFQSTQGFLSILARSTTAGPNNVATVLANELWTRNENAGADRAAATVYYLSDAQLTASRIGDANRRAEAAQALASLGDAASTGLQRSIAAGLDPTTALDIATQMQKAGQSASAEIIRKAVVAGVQQFKNIVTADIKKLAAHDAELAYLVDNYRGAMTNEQLDAAVKNYRREKGASWQQQENKLREQIGHDGKLLAAQLVALGQQRSPATDSALHVILSDKSVEMAISTALQMHPELVDRQHVDGMLNLFTSAQLGDVGRTYLNEMASSYLRENVLKQLGNVNLLDLRSVDRAKKLLEGMRGERLATMLGVAPERLDGAVDALLDAWYQSGTGAGQAQRAIQNFERNLRKDARLLSAFDPQTVRGAMFRTVGVALAGVAVVNSYKSAVDQPTLQNEMRLLLDSAGFAHKTAETLVGIGWISKESALGRFADWKAFGRATASDVIGGAVAMLDIISAAESFSNGEHGLGIASMVTASGGILSMLPAMGLGGAWLGPVGVALTAAGVLGKEVFTAYKETHKYDQVSRSFLKAGGFSDAAVAELSRMCNYAGSSQVAFLAKYAALKGMTPVELQRWVNSLTSQQLERLSGLLMRAVIDCDGDPARFSAAEYKGGPDQSRVILAPRGVDSNDPVPVRVPLMSTVEVFESGLDERGLQPFGGNPQ